MLSELFMARKSLLKFRPKFLKDETSRCWSIQGSADFGRSVPGIESTGPREQDERPIVHSEIERRDVNTILSGTT